MRKKVLLAVFAGTCLLSLAACGGGNDTEPVIELVAEEDNAGYAMVTAGYGDVVRNLKVSCSYTATSQEDIYLDPEDGYVEQINVKKGDIVQKGELLFLLDVDYLEAEMEELEYQIDSLTLKLAHTKELEAFDLSSTEFLFTYTAMTKDDEERMADELDKIERSYEGQIKELEDSLYIAQKKLEQYRKEWNEGHVTAGIYGMVTYMNDMVLQGQPIDSEVKVITISNLDSCYFIVEDMTYVDFFRDITGATVTYLDTRGWSYCEVAPVLTEQWDTVMYFAPVGDEMLDIGLPGDIVVELERKENVLCIPNAALHESEEGDFVYVSEDGLLEMRYVTVGLRGSEMTEITGGISQGEEIVLKR